MNDLWLHLKTLLEAILHRTLVDAPELLVLSPFSFRRRVHALIRVTEKIHLVGVIEVAFAFLGLSVFPAGVIPATRS